MIFQQAITCSVQRRYDGVMPPWLVLIHAFAVVPGPAGMPQARCAMDDFGYLVPVGGWH